MNDTTIPPLPPGFELEDEIPESAHRNPPATYPHAAEMIAGVPPLPAGFELEPDEAGGLELDIVGNWDAAGNPLPATPVPDDPTVGMSNTEKFLAGAGKSVDDTIRGIKQVGSLSYATQSELAARALDAVGADGAAGFLRENITQPAATVYGSEIALERERRQQNAPLMETKAGIAGNVAGSAAQIAAGGYVLRGTQGAAMVLPRTVAGNAAQGAALGALQPAVSENERAMNVGVGAAAGAAFSKAGDALSASAGRAKSAITDQARAIAQVAKDRGIPLTAAQLSNSRFMKWMASYLRDMPGTGARQRLEQQVGQWNREVAKTIGEDAPYVNSEVFARAKARQSATFEDLTARNDMQVNDRLMRSLTNIENSAQISPEAHTAVAAALDRLYAQAITTRNGVVIPGAAYQAFDSAVNQVVKGGGPVAHYVGQVQRAVRRAMDESIAPADREAWKRVRAEYANRKTIEPLVAKAADEPLPPAQLMGVVTNSKAGKGAMAEGRRGELGELAKIGQRLKEPANSGTVPRTVAGEFFDLAKIPFRLASIPAAAVASGIIDSQTLVKVMMRDNPGMTREAAAQLIRRLAPVAAPAAARQVNAFREMSGGREPAAQPQNAFAQPRGGR